MNVTSWLIYRLATVADCDSLVTLINKSYENDSTCQGWTNTNKLLVGPRTNVNELHEIINTNGSIILMFFDTIEQILIGCIHLKYKEEIKSGYLCMLCVRPDLQKKGYGKLFLSIGEKYAISNWNIDCLEISVMIQRTELIAFYNRRGYIDTGQRCPFPSSDLVKPKRNDLEFCLMQKSVTKNVV